MGQIAKMSQRPDGQMVDENGVLYDDRTYTFIAIHKRERCKEPFVRMWDDGLQALALDKDFRGRPMAILVYLMGNLDFGNYALVTQADIAKAMDMPRPDVSVAFKLLVEKGVLQEGPRAGRSKSYRLNSSYGWKGKPIQLNERRKQEATRHAQQLDLEGQAHPNQHPI